MNQLIEIDTIVYEYKYFIIFILFTFQLLGKIMGIHCKSMLPQYFDYLWYFSSKSELISDSVTSPRFEETIQLRNQMLESASHIELFKSRFSFFVINYFSFILW